MPGERLHVSKIVEKRRISFNCSVQLWLACQIEVERFSEFYNVTKRYLVDESVKTTFISIICEKSNLYKV